MTTNLTIIKEQTVWRIMYNGRTRFFVNETNLNQSQLMSIYLAEVLPQVETGVSYVNWLANTVIYLGAISHIQDNNQLKLAIQQIYDKLYFTVDNYIHLSTLYNIVASEPASDIFTPIPHLDGNKRLDDFVATIVSKLLYIGESRGKEDIPLRLFTGDALGHFFDTIESTENSDEFVFTYNRQAILDYKGQKD